MGLSKFYLLSISRCNSQFKLASSLELKAVYPLLSKAFNDKYWSVTLKGLNARFRKVLKACKKICKVTELNLEQPCTLIVEIIESIRASRCDRSVLFLLLSLSDLVKYLPEIDLGGSYIELTLLDPHPANNEFELKTFDEGTNPDNMGSTLDNILSGNLIQGWLSIPIIPVPDKIAFDGYFKEAKKAVEEFQSKAYDPAIEIPPGVKKLDVWYQHTPANQLVESPDQEWLINLWGLKDNAIHNNSGIPIELDKNLFDLTTKTNAKPAVGHNEVPNEYDEQVVKTGKLNRSGY
jgi:hypothetical protein